MKPSFSRTLVLTMSFLALATTALAHPGHDDGHELTWELGHLAAHPLATFGCVALLATAGWVAFQVFRGRDRLTPQSLRGSQVRRGK